MRVVSIGLRNHKETLPRKMGKSIPKQIITGTLSKNAAGHSTNKSATNRNLCLSQLSIKNILIIKNQNVKV